MPRIKTHANRNYHECQWCNETIHLNVLGEWEHSKDGMKNCDGGISRHMATPKDNCECKEKSD